MPILSFMLVLLVAAAPSGATEAGPFLKLMDDALVAGPDIRLRVAQPAGYRLAGPVQRQATFNEHPYAIALAAFIASEAFVMVHAERVLDRSGASDYSGLERREWNGLEFRSRDVCADLSPEDVAGEHDLQFLGTHGFAPQPALYLRQLYRTSDDANAEVVLTYGERVDSCRAAQGNAEFMKGFESRMTRAVNVRMEAS